MKRAALGNVLVAAVLAGATPAAAASATYTINIKGYVPVICNVNTTLSTTDQTSTTYQGSLSEFCNNPSGYQIWVDYTPGVSGASITLDGTTTVALSSTGSTMISASQTAATGTHTISLDPGSDGTKVTSLSMRIQPI